MSDVLRTTALQDLVSLRRPLEESLLAVRGLPWDSDVELVAVGRWDVRSLLERYLRRELTASDVERWADALESRDDVGVDPRLPDDLLYALATQDLEGTLTEDRARQILLALAENGST